MGLCDGGVVSKLWRYPVKSLLKVSEPTERCRMTTLAQGDLPGDPSVLRTLGQDADALFGVYAEVLAPGRIARGDAVVTVPAPAGAR